MTMREIIWLLALALQLGLSLGQSRNEEGSAQKKTGKNFHLKNVQTCSKNLSFLTTCALDRGCSTAVEHRPAEHLWAKHVQIWQKRSLKKLHFQLGWSAPSFTGKNPFYGKSVGLHLLKGPV